jgi:uncharacterized membrane protein
MNKSKLGISLGLFGFILYMVGMFSGFLATLALAVFILCFEEDRWIRRTAVKAVMVLITFSLLGYLIGIIPSILSLVDNTLYIFEESFDYHIVSKITSLLQSIVGFTENVILVILALLSLKQMSIKIPVVDDMINKHIQ